VPIVGFLDRLFGREIDEARLEPHRARAGELAAQLVSLRGLDDAERRRRMRRLPDTDDATLVSLAVVLADELRRGSVGADGAMAQLAVLARTPLPFQPDDIGLLVELAAATKGTRRRRILSVATAGCERRLLALVPGDTVDALAFDLMARGDEWSRLVRPTFDARFRDDPVAHALLELMASLHQTTPRQIWLRRSAELVTGSEGRAGELVRVLLGALAFDLKPGGEGRPVVNSSNAELLRGAAWVAVTTGEPWVVSLLIDVHRRSRELRIEKVANASLAALGRLGTPEAVTELAQRWWAERRRGARIDVERALAAAGRHDGATIPALLEPHIPLRSSTPVVRAERRRIDATLGDDRVWNLPMWTVRYLEHRVTGPLSRTLVWTVEDGPHR
jgi:hypothetical protein